MSSGALSFVRSIKTVTATTMPLATIIPTATGGVATGVPRLIVQTLDQTRPTIAGARPCEMTVRHGDCEKRSQTTFDDDHDDARRHEHADGRDRRAEQRAAGHRRVAD